MKMTAYKTSSRRHQRGIGLVEIMIAMVLAAVMFNGLMEIFLSSRQTYNATDNLTRLQEKYPDFIAVSQPNGLRLSLCRRQRV